MKSTTTGLNLAIAIALHNIPEGDENCQCESFREAFLLGVAVALPVYFATRSRWMGFKYATLSGMAEPLAVIFMALIMPVGHSMSFSRS